MSGISDVMNAQAGAVDQAAGSAGAAAANEESNQAMGKDDFLKLLITQLNFQDPLSPMKNEDFVAQLAQFSSLEQLVAVNERLDGLAMAQMAQSSASAVNFIGKDVRVMADWVDHDGDSPTDIGFELLGNADSVTLTITDEGGDVVRTENLGQKDEGTQNWTWDGNDKNGSPIGQGTYTVTVTAKDAEGNQVTAYATALGRINGVSYENGYPELMIGKHSVALSDVIEVLEE